MTLKKITELPSNADYYNLKDKLINYVSKKSFEQFDNADNLRNTIKTKKDFLNYQKNAQNVLNDIIGTLPYDKSIPLNPQINGVIKCDGFNIEKIVFESRKGVYVTSNLYMPRNIEGKIPAILMQLGHAQIGKNAVRYQKVARMLVNSGFAVLVMDPVGQGERLSYVDPDTNTPIIKGATDEHLHFGNQSYLVGEYPLKFFVADAMRGIDYLETREEIDKDKIGATGNSGGGTLTAVTTAFDKRIKAAAVSCFLTTRRAYYYAGGIQDCEQIFVNGTKNNFDHYELVACCLPRPLMILSVESDFFPLEGTDKLFEKCKEFYKIMGCEDNLRRNVDKGPHRYSTRNGMEATRFFKKVFFEDDSAIEKKDYDVFENDELNCTKSGYVVTEYKDAKIIFDENLSIYKNAPKKTMTEKRDFFYSKVMCGREDTKFYLKQLATPVFNDYDVKRFMWYSQPNMPCHGVMLKNVSCQGKNLPVKICIFENGTNDLSKYDKELKKILDTGFSAFIVDLSGMGKCEPYETLTGKDLRGTVAKLASDMLFSGDSLCALKTYDLIRTIKMVKEELGISEVSLVGAEKASVYVRIAEILENIETEFINEVSIEDIITDKYYDHKNYAEIIMPKIALYLK